MGWNDLAIELWAFRRALSVEDGGLGQAGHFKNVCRILWPKKLANGRDNPKYFEFHPWAEKMLEAACAHKFLGVAGCGSSGKCLAPHTPVLRFDGSICRADEVRVGDQLMGDDSTARNVFAANPGRSNMVRIVPVQGESWECNDDHILTIKRTWAGERSRHLVGTVRDISVKDYLATSQTFKNQHALFCVGVEFPEQYLDFDPYIYGVWLGNGSKGRPVITSPDSEKGVNQRLTSFAANRGFRLHVSPNTKRCPNYAFSTVGAARNPFLDLARESSGMTTNRSPAGKEKRILRRYLINSRENRLHLLAGIIDTDGYAAGTYFEISCSKRGLTDDIAFLARSLGFRVTVTPRTTTCGGKKFPSFRINIQGNVGEIPTTRKKCHKKTLRTQSDCTNFRVEQIGEGDWYGFELDGNGRFLLGDFTVTHNTRFFALWAIVKFISAPRKTLVLVVSTSLKDSRERIWGAIEDYWLAVPGLPGKLISSAGRIRFAIGDEKISSDLCGISLLAGDQSKAKEAAANLIGKKAPPDGELVLIADEAPELAGSINDAAMGNLVLAEKFQFIQIGNPKSRYDTFGWFIAPKAGWDSIHSEMEEWETIFGWCLRFDGLKSPNWLAGRNVYKYLIKVEDIQRMIDAGEQNTLKFWRMYRGFFAPSGISGTVFSEADIIKFGGDKGCIWQSEPVLVAALDAGFTSGGDESALRFARWGVEAGTGLSVLLLDDLVILHEDVTNKEVPRNFQIAQAFRNECEKRGVRPENAAIDSTNIPFADIVSQVWSHRVLRVPFGGAATERPVSEFSPEPAKDNYGNRVSEIWHSGMEFLKHRQLRGIKPDLARELTEREEKTLKAGGKLKSVVESKVDMKARLGRSPDNADASMVVVDLIRERFRGKSPKFASTGGDGRGQRAGVSPWTRTARRYDVYGGQDLLRGV